MVRFRVNIDAIQQLQIPQLDGAVDPLQNTNSSRKNTRASRYSELNVTVCQSPNKADNLGILQETIFIEVCWFIISIWF